MYSRIKHIKFAQFVFIAVVVLPIISGIIYASLYSFGVVGILNKTPNADAWKAVLFGKPFWSAFAFSLYIALISVSISIVIALTIAISWRNNLYKGLLSTAIYLPLCFPSTVMAFFSFQMLAKSGFLSRIGYEFNWIDDLKSFPSIVNDAYGIGIIFTSILLVTPFFIILFSNLYKSEKVIHYSELAQTFGASKRQILWKVIVPILLKKATPTIGLFIIFVMSSYEVPLLLGRQNPEMISVAILQKIQRFNLNDIPQGYAMSVLYVILIILVLVIFHLKNRYSLKSHTV